MHNYSLTTQDIVVYHDMQQLGLERNKTRINYLKFVHEIKTFRVYE
jgi:hypothetical protein